jgi:predicted RNA binding protein YcfA (HicA-like mRNA interferase family)
MGRLAGFKYRKIVKKLKKLGFEFDRHAAGSHEIWYNPVTIAIQRFQIMLVIFPKERCERSSNKHLSLQKNS